MSYVVMLDAGHGGWDPGASYYGRQEKNDNLNLALAVGNILEQKGIPVIYTRTSDVYQTPFEKAEMANRSDADFFVCHLFLLSTGLFSQIKRDLNTDFRSPFI